MNALKFNYKNKKIVLTVLDISYTFGHIMTVVDIYFKESKTENLPSKIRLMVNNDKIDNLIEVINSSNYIDLDNYGSYIDSIKFYYSITGYVSEDDVSSVLPYFNIEPDESLLDWSDTVNDSNNFGDLEKSDILSCNETFFSSDNNGINLDGNFNESIHDVFEELESKSKVGEFYGQ